VSALDDAKFGMMIGMLRKLYTPKDAAEFATYLSGKAPADVAFVRECLHDLGAALDALPAEPEPFGAPILLVR
jgi:hypothetical protein